MDYQSIAKEFSNFVSGFAKTEQETGYPAVVRLLPASPARILDFGCGNGQFCHSLDRLGYETMGVDTSSAMIKQATNAGINCLRINRSLRCFPEASFNAATANFVFCTMASLETVAYWMGEIGYVIRPGGYLIFLTSNYEEAQGVEFASFRIEPAQHLKSGSPVTVILKGKKELSVTTGR
ncbi:methyltransferase domain-containing protein [Patescibacteria group bacterium]|nr:methyltransferase domain-containing protein [Patescibacteria group bacterium]